MIKLEGLENVHEEVYMGRHKSHTQRYHYGLLFWNQPIQALSSVLRQTRTIEFEYHFMAIEASIREFQHMCIVVAMDGTFLKNKYDGILYLTSCFDRNEQIYLLEFDIWPSENDASYTYFFFQSLWRCMKTMLI